MPDTSFYSSPVFLSATAERPLRVAFLNLMPAKRAAEDQLRALLSEGSREVELTPLRVASPEQDEKAHRDWVYAQERYEVIGSVLDRTFDAFVVNGAPLGQKRFEDVTFWPELTQAFNWASRNVSSTLNICWAAAAALKHFHEIERRLAPEKLFGVYPQLVANTDDPLVKDCPPHIDVPVSRFSTVDHEQVRRVSGLEIVLASPVTGVGLVRDAAHNQVLCFNHPEYAANTLAKEFWRDRERDITTRFPVSTFPHDDIQRVPEMKWAYAREIISINWLNEVAAKAAADQNRQGAVAAHRSACSPLTCC